MAVAQSIPQDIIDKLARRAYAQRKSAQGLRRLADFDDEIADALARFYGLERAQPGGQSDGRNER